MGSMGSHTGNRNMEAWLYRLTENKVVDFLRKVHLDTRLKQAILRNLQEIINEPKKPRVKLKECSQIIQKAIDQVASRSAGSFTASTGKKG